MSEHAATPHSDKSQTPPALEGLRGKASEITGYWWVWLVAGIAWLIVSLVLLQFDDASVTTIGILVGLMFLLASVQNFVLAAVSDSLRWLWAMFGALFVIAGVACFVNPEETFAGIADMLGFLFLLLGIWWMVRSFLERAVNPLWWLGLISGVLMTCMAFWTAGQFFFEKAYILLVFAGIWALMEGMGSIVRAFTVRQLHKELQIESQTAPNVRPDPAEERRESLRANPRVDDHEIAVECFDGGYVVLRGRAENLVRSTQAKRTAYEVPGVRTVDDQLSPRRPGASDRADARTEAAVLNAFIADHPLPAETMHVHALDGTVTLSGRFDFPYQREEAEGVAIAVPGVPESRNHLSVLKARPEYRAQRTDRDIMLAVVGQDRLPRIRERLADETEFLSPHGLRSLSAISRDHPFEFWGSGQIAATVGYEPVESTAGMYGGNSNWRGPIWFPMNYLVIAALERYARRFGDRLRTEFPLHSGRRLTLAEITVELAQRLVSICLDREDGHRPVFGGVERFQRDPAWHDALLFHEYFHGDDGAGLGASHQTGWTGLVADMIVRLSNARRSA